jgi:hypothetical protein
MDAGNWPHQVNNKKALPPHDDPLFSFCSLPQLNHILQLLVLRGRTIHSTRLFFAIQTSWLPPIDFLEATGTFAASASAYERSSVMHLPLRAQRRDGGEQ